MALGVGIELGPSVLRTVVLDRAGAAITLVSARETPCDAANPEAFARALLQVRQALRLTQPIVLGLPGAAAILTTVNPLVVNAQRAELAVQFELQQHLPFELAQAAWHYQWLSAHNGRANGSARRPDPAALSSAAAAAMRRTTLEQRLASCRRAGVAVRAVTINSMASLNACLGEEGIRVGRPLILLHLLNGQTAEWIVRTAKSLQVIPVSSPSAAALWEDLAASWQQVRADYPELGEGPVRLLQADSGEPDASVRCAQSLGVPVEPVKENRLLRGSARIEEPARYLAATGLALQAIGLAPVALNLLAGSQRQQQADRTRGISHAVSAVCLTAALVLGFNGMTEVRRRRLLVLQSLEARERLYQSLRPEVRALLQQQQHVQQRTQQLERLANQVPLLTQVLGQIADALPDDVWLAKAECVKTGLVEGTLEGRAKSFQEVTKFLERLKTAAGMATVKPLSTNVTPDPATGKEVVAFVVEVQRPLVAP